MAKMNPVVKARWVAALRSGEYKQTKEALRTAAGFCCLGVLCDLHALETGANWEAAESGLGYLGNCTVLPNEVKSWAGLYASWGAEVSIDGSSKAVTGQNDDGRTFAEIADAIEAQL